MLLAEEQKQRSIDNTEIDLRKYSQMIFDNGAKPIQWSEDSFSIVGAVAMDIYKEKNS